MIEKLDQRLKDKGVDDIRFYYKNCPFAGNIFTACLLISKDKRVLARGVSICSIIEFHLKKEGRKRSKDRAMKAFFTKTNSEIIFPKAREDYGYVQKCFKIKTEEDKKLMRNAYELGFDCIYKESDQNEKLYNKLYVNIPYNYPIAEASKLFTFKSEFNPAPTADEVHAFKLSL